MYELISLFDVPKSDFFERKCLPQHYTKRAMPLTLHYVLQTLYLLEVNSYLTWCLLYAKSLILLSRQNVNSEVNKSHPFSRPVLGSKELIYLNSFNVCSEKLVVHQLSSPISVTMCHLLRQNHMLVTVSNLISKQADIKWASPKPFFHHNVQVDFV